MLNPKVFIPDKYIIISCYNIRVQEPLCIPPNVFQGAKRVNSHKHHNSVLGTKTRLIPFCLLSDTNVYSSLGPFKLIPLSYSAVIMKQDNSEVL